MNLNSLKENKKGGCNRKESCIKKNFPDEYSYILKYAKTNNLLELKFKQQVWHAIYNVKNIQYCYCGKPLVFVLDNYRQFCSSKCSTSSTTVQNKIKQTNLERYGVESATQNDSVKNKIKKTNLKKYGTECVFQSDIIKDKIKKTNLERYGVENPYASKEIQEKIKQTNLKRYGYEYASQSDIIKQKFKQTNLDRLGVEFPSQSNEIREKIKQTNLERYGVTHNLQIEDVKNKIKENNIKTYGCEYILQSPIIREKIKQTNLERYGAENPYASKLVQEKIKQTNLKRYGVENYSNSNEFKKHLEQKWINIWKNRINNITNFNYDSNELTIICDTCNKEYTINSWLAYQRYSNNYETCLHCRPLNYNITNVSLGQTQISQFILNITNEQLISNNKDTIKPFELDIYIPTLKLAIEFNGVYWHSELFKDKSYHFNKTNKCVKHGIKLIHIWEDDWNLKQEIIKSRILNLLNKTATKIFARKCQIKEISPKQSKIFLNQNHLQGYVASSIKIGLFYENELVSLMTFGKLRKSLNSTTNKKDQYEMYRFCSRLNTNVVGAASKLFKYFIKTYTPNYIVTYFDRSWSNSNVYQKLGFDFQGNTEPNYWYLIKGIKSHRFNHAKHKLVKQGYDKNMTEVEIMHSLGHFRLFGPGNEKWTWTLTQ